MKTSSFITPVGGGSLDLEWWIRFIGKDGGIAFQVEKTALVYVMPLVRNKFRNVDWTQIGRTLKSLPREECNSGKLWVISDF